MSAVAVHGLPVLWHLDRYWFVRGTGARTSVTDLIVRVDDVPTVACTQCLDIVAVEEAAAICRTAYFDGAVAGIVAADAALHRKSVSVADLEIAGSRYLERRRGARIKELLARTNGLAEAPSETLLRLGLEDLGVTTQPQVVISDDQGFVGRVDLLDAANSTIYEFDGRLKYSSGDPDVLWAEKIREDRLRRLGYRVVRVIWADLTPSRLAALVRSRRP